MKKKTKPKTSLGVSKKKQDKAWELLQKRKKALKKPYPKKPVKIVAPKKRINSRNKGKQGELELVNFLKERNVESRRGQQYEGSSDSPDVIAGGCLRDVHIEVKRKEAGNIYDWLEQACTDADLAKMPVVAHRRNGRRWIAIMDFRDFLNIMETLTKK